MIDQPNIIIRGAREHNLKSVNISLPRNQFIITGLSGSGKSALLLIQFMLKVRDDM